MGFPTLTERLRRINEVMVPAGRNHPYTIAEVAAGTGISESMVGYLFSGKRPNPSGETISKLARFYGVPTDYFLGDADSYRRIEKQLSDLQLLKVLSRQPIAEITELLGDMSDPDLAVIREVVEKFSQARANAKTDQALP